MKKIILAMLLALPMTMFAQKIGHVNFETVIQGMPEYAAAQTEFQNLQKQLSEEMQRKQTEFQTKNEAYEKEKATLSETLRTYREQELQKAYEELSQFAQTCEQELQKVQQTKMGELQDKVLKAVQEIGAAGGFAYILPANGIAYIGASAIDITDQVKAKVGAK
jgi:outer membrane protein